MSGFDLNPLKPYLGIAKLVAIAAACVYLYARGHSAGVDSERRMWQARVSEARQQRLDEYESKLAQAREDKATSDKESAKFAATAKQSEEDYKALLAKIPTKPLVTHDEPKPGDVCPPAPRLSPDFRLRFNEAALGSGPAPR